MFNEMRQDDLVNINGGGIGKIVVSFAKEVGKAFAVDTAVQAIKAGAQSYYESMVNAPPGVPPTPSRGEIPSYQ